MPEVTSLPSPEKTLISAASESQHQKLSEYSSQFDSKSLVSEASKTVEKQQLPIRKISDKLVDSITDKPWLEIVQETKTQLKMEKTAASLKKELSIESEQASKKVLIKVSSSCETIDFLIKNAEQKLKKEGNEEQKESIIKEVEYLKGVKENCLSVNGIVEELDKKIRLSQPKKRVNHKIILLIIS